ncbi:hypothetical protein TNCV_1242271 [Trichonephila clavipes]|nr:hypothetical protein TNCV_1242271 [Trichonephila clavipes]
MNVRSMQILLNNFLGYGVLKVGIFLGRYLGEFSVENLDDYPLQHLFITVFLLRHSPDVGLHRRHLTETSSNYHASFHVGEVGHNNALLRTEFSHATLTRPNA